MAPNLTACSVVAGALLLGLSQWPARAGDEQVTREEPRLELFLETGGREVPVELDRELELAAPDGKLRLTVRARAWRRLALPGLTLRYPSAWHFEYEREELHEQWTLSGSDTVLMLFHIPEAPGADDAAIGEVFAASMREQFGERGKLEPLPTLELGGVALPGKRLRAQVTANVTIVQDVYAHLHEDGSCTVLVLQHSPTDARQEPTETKTFRQQMVESLTWR